MARLILRDLVNATVGFEALAAETAKPSKSLHRMLSKNGNASMDNLGRHLRRCSQAAGSKPGGSNCRSGVKLVRDDDTKGQANVLPIIDRCLATLRASTTALYAHLDNDPLRRASEAIAGRIAATLDGKSKGLVVSLRRSM